MEHVIIAWTTIITLCIIISYNQNDINLEKDFTLYKSRHNVDLFSLSYTINNWSVKYLFMEFAI